jgi:hypothetical protein
MLAVPAEGLKALFFLVSGYENEYAVYENLAQAMCAQLKFKPLIKGK